jgi:hypothetical protein
MKKQKQEFTVVDCWGLNCSMYGNPKRGLTLLDNNGEYYTAKTATDASVAYLLGYYSKGRKYSLTYHYTRNGNMIIDYGQAVEA